MGGDRSPAARKSPFSRRLYLWYDSDDRNIVVLFVLLVLFRSLNIEEKIKKQCARVCVCGACAAFGPTTRKTAGVATAAAVHATPTGRNALAETPSAEITFDIGQYRAARAPFARPPLLARGETV